MISKGTMTLLKDIGVVLVLIVLSIASKSQGQNVMGSIFGLAAGAMTGFILWVLFR